MAVIGDSLTTGRLGGRRAASTASRNSWAGGDDPADGVTSHYERLLAANPRDRGQRRQLRALGLADVGHADRGRRAVASGTPFDYVTFMAGSNDVCGAADAPLTDPRRFRAQYRADAARS